MQKRDNFLALVPIIIAAIVVGAIALLLRQLNSFNDSYRREVEKELRIQTIQTVWAVSPMLEQKNYPGLEEYCNSFANEPTRVTVLDAHGKVIAESQRDPSILDSHADRPEILSAVAGTPMTVTRYSTTLNEEMIYYAAPITVGDEKYILRISISTENMSRLLARSRKNIFFAMAVGIGISLAIAAYILLRVRMPFNRLQESAVRIAMGDLNAEIFIPRSRVLAELARAVDSMAGQLKQRIQELTHERNERDAAFNAMSEAVMLVEPDGKIVKWNRTAATIFNIPEKQSVYYITSCASPELVAYVKQAFGKEEPPWKEITMVTPSQTMMLLLHGVKLIRKQSEQLLLSVTDLTSLRRLESFRSDFIANVSHEIKTPLTGILSAVEFLEDNPAAASQKNSRCFQILKQQAARLNSLVHDILSLAALERKEVKSERDFVPVQLDAILNNTAAMCQDAAREAGINLSVKTSSPVTVTGDAGMLEQAVTNLIVNAIKYSESSEVEILMIPGRKQVQVIVRDNGIGIPPEHARRIFERFYRVDKARSRELGGTGLGLAIVKHIVQLHCGNVIVNSIPGKGCEFVITLPLPPPKP